MTLFFLSERFPGKTSDHLPSLPALSDITATKNLKMQSSACQSGLRAKWGHADGHCFSHKNETVPTSAVSRCKQNKHYFIRCFRCWTKQPQPHAKSSARCIMGTIYQSHHALQALNTATVFFVTLFFAAIFLTSPSLSGQLLCWCSCLFLMPVKKRGWGWKWREEQVCRLSDRFALTCAQCTSVYKRHSLKQGCCPCALHVSA